MSNRNYRFIWGYELTPGITFRDGRTVTEVRPGKTSQFVKVTLSDGLVKTYDKADTVIVAAEA